MRDFLWGRGGFMESIMSIWLIVPVCVDQLDKGDWALESCWVLIMLYKVRVCGNMDWIWNLYEGRSLIANMELTDVNNTLEQCGGHMGGAFATHQDGLGPFCIFHLVWGRSWVPNSILETTLDGRGTFQDCYQELFRFARDRDAQVSDYLEWVNDKVYWNPRFTREAQDWELGVNGSILGWFVWCTGHS